MKLSHALCVIVFLGTICIVYTAKDNISNDKEPSLQNEPSKATEERNKPPKVPSSSTRKKFSNPVWKQNKCTQKQNANDDSSDKTIYTYDMHEQEHLTTDSETEPDEQPTCSKTLNQTATKRKLKIKDHNNDPIPNKQLKLDSDNPPLEDPEHTQDQLSNSNQQKRSLAAERKRTARKNETPEQAEKRRTKDKIRSAQRRERLKQSALTEPNAPKKHKQTTRQNETPEQTENRHTKDKIRSAQRREKLKQSTLTEPNAPKKAPKRKLNETFEESEERRSKVKQKATETRLNKLETAKLQTATHSNQPNPTDNDSLQCNLANTKIHDSQRETQEQADARRESNRISMARQRTHQQHSQQKKQNPQTTIYAGRQLHRVLNGEQVVLYSSVEPLFKPDGTPTSPPCEFCQAVKWKNETPGMCCTKGKVEFTQFPQHPQLIASLYEDQTFEAITFRKYSRQLNNALALASLKATEPRMPGMGWTPSVILQGKLYIRLGPICVTNGLPPAFSQIYVLDPEHANTEAEIRFNHMRLPSSVSQREKDVLKALLVKLQAELHKCNPYVHDFKHACEIINDDNPETIKLVIDENKRPQTDHIRRYNEGFKEISVVYNDAEPDKRAFVLALRGPGNHLKEIEDTNRAVDPLHFTLLFPNGTPGWHLGLPKKPGETCTVPPLQFYAYHLQIRHGAGGSYNESIFRGSKLFHEYLCVNFAKVENQRLKYIAANQKSLRGDSYKRVCEDVAIAEENNTTARSGQQVILPPSFTGSPRYMHAHFQDAMAIVRVYRKPDLFITYTMNPACPEVIDSLLPGQKPQDRPDIISRVFNQKFKSFMTEIVKNSILGKVTAYMWVIEFQKRGLPHAHLLLILDEKDRLRNADQVDTIITAELPPDPETFPEGPQRIQAEKLQAAVLKNMIHACGPICKTDGGNCKKGFPKAFNDTTEWDDTAMYPRYRRRSPNSGGRVISHNGRIIDNQYVVPYNPYLLLRFDAHINIEACVFPTAAKYLFKYVTKGGDRAMLAVENDEVQQFQNGRSIGPSEATHRLYKFDITQRFPPVMALRVHLQDEQYITFQEGQEAEVVGEGPKHTELTAFFDYNTNHPETSIRYIDFPKHLIWDKKSGKWQPRKQGTMIGRVHTIHPLSGDEFYLRILLHHNHCKGATCYEDLRRVNNKTHETFKEACVELGLLQHDGEWHNALQEANTTGNCTQLRSLFVVMLLFCEIAEPLTLYINHQAQWMDDYKRKYPHASDHELDVMVRMDIEKKLQLRGKSLASFGLPTITATDKENISAITQTHIGHQQSVVMQEEVGFDMVQTTQTRDNRIAMLMPSQRAVFDKVMNAVMTNQSLNLFIDARGGTGKTFVLNTILAASRTCGNIKTVGLAAASSGIAATLLNLGRTFHSRFKVPLKSHETMTFSVKPNDSVAEVIKEANVIVWDEAPMTHKHLLEGLDRMLRDITQCDLPFGGKILILAGDFRQILPVIPHGSRAQITSSSMRKSFLWHHFTVMKLQENMRIGTNPLLKEFDTWLEQLGNGQLEIAQEPDSIRLPPSASILYIDDTNSDTLRASMLQFIHRIFPNMIQEFQRSTGDWINWVSGRAILAPKNSEVDQINKVLIDYFLGKSETLCSADSTVDPNEATKFPPEYLNSLTPAGMPPHELHLKEGIVLMLLRNLNPKNGLCNGTRLILTKVTSRILYCKIATGDKAGDQVFIPRIELTSTDGEFPFKWKRRQFPVRPAFAMTINKSQGQTLQCVGVWLYDDVFTHVQLYVASSRVGHPDHLHFAIKLQNNGLVRNVVYDEALI